MSEPFVKVASHHDIDMQKEEEIGSILLQDLTLYVKQYCLD
jgi:hypothetical protein